MYLVVGISNLYANKCLLYFHWLIKRLTAEIESTFVAHTLRGAKRILTQMAEYA